MNGPLQTLTLACVLLPVAAFAQSPLWDSDPNPFEFATLSVHTPFDAGAPLLRVNVKQSNAEPGQWLGVDDGNDEHSPWMQPAPVCFVERDPGPIDLDWFRIDWARGKLNLRVGTFNGETWTVDAEPGLWPGEWNGYMSLRAVFDPCAAPGVRVTWDPFALPVRIVARDLIDVGNDNFFARWPFAVP